ncbi:hypothetical protein [Streptomyces sp. Wb2n-11]|uniref:hypothetical protein n=1 Tax=Streptomyces sp. Wb2n-11 TaxID=1030533 RepID=UPI000AEA99CC|nr:hypothetical protein [Streptomyces sp. Wb2n-11]
MKTALEALSNINAGDVLVSGGPHPGTAIVVAFAGQYLGDDQAQMTASAAGLTGGTTPAVTVTTTTAGGGAAPADGTDILAGFLVSEISFNPGSTKAAGALLWHGEIFAEQCPVPFDPTDVGPPRPASTSTTDSRRSRRWKPLSSFCETPAPPT